MKVNGGITGKRSAATRANNSIIVYCDYGGGEFQRGCRITYGRRVSPKPNEFVYGVISCKSSDGMERMIKTAENENSHRPHIVSLLRELSSVGEITAMKTTGEVALQYLYETAISRNFPSLAPVMRFDMTWYAKDSSGKRYPVSLSVRF